MKAVFLLIAVISLLPLAKAAEDLPPDAQRLSTKRAEEIARVEKAYLQELEKLKLNYVKRGDSDNAAKIDRLSKLAGLNQDSMELFMEGEWHFQWGKGSQWAKDTNKYSRFFKGDRLKDNQGNSHPWTFQEGVITVSWRAGGFEKLLFDRSNPDMIYGFNSNEECFIYSRKNRADK